MPDPDDALALIAAARRRAARLLALALDESIAPERWRLLTEAEIARLAIEMGVDVPDPDLK